MFETQNVRSSIMKLMSVNENIISNDKEQLMYIFNSYLATRPAQTNLFDTVLRSYRGDLLDNAGNVELQMEAIKNSLRTILSRYGYSKHDVEIKFDGLNNEFIIEIDSTTKDGNSIKLSETVIFEK